MAGRFNKPKQRLDIAFTVVRLAASTASSAFLTAMWSAAVIIRIHGTSHLCPAAQWRARRGVGKLVEEGRRRRSLIWNYCIKMVGYIPDVE